ncbi:MAG TPA: HAMP domain-containing sensor histidine kinase, partial [Nitrospiria bacterium]|nr:HAMP domain-containing sensor histidine kinase [Nitrospiria bacterium]
ICINLSVTGFFRHMFRITEDTSFQRSVIHYVNYLVKEIGDPPDLDRAEKIAEESSIEIRYESPDVNWSTSKSHALPPQMELRPWQGYPNVRTGGFHGLHFLVLERGKGRYVFELAHAFNRDASDMKAVVLLVVLLTAILAAAYLLIRWILRPVRKLSDGVREVGKGNLDYRISMKRSDELGELAEAFNAMTRRIRNMLRAKEQLMLDVSHELRSPLTRMKLALESVPEGRAKECIREDVSDMEKMVTEVLKTARSHYMHGQLNLRRVDIVALLKGVISTFKDRRPGIEADEMPDRIDLSIDPDRVKSVLMNVLENAIKYSFNSSKPVEVTMEHCRPYLIVRVRDHGIGIPEDELSYVFEPFYRVDKSRSKETGGFGLGLSLCKTVMEAHHGKIEVDSAPDGGTVISLFFPV